MNDSTDVLPNGKLLVAREVYDRGLASREYGFSRGPSLELLFMTKRGQREQNSTKRQNSSAFGLGP